MKILILDAQLSVPPSQVQCFRSLSLFFYKKAEILIECPNDEKDIWWRWLKYNGAFDFCSEIVTEDEKEVGFRVASQKRHTSSYIVERINESNLYRIIQGVEFYLL